MILWKLASAALCKRKRLEVIKYFKIIFTSMYVTQSPDLDSVQRPAKVNFRLYPNPYMLLKDSFGCQNFWKHVLLGLPVLFANKDWLLGDAQTQDNLLRGIVNKSGAAWSVDKILNGPN